MAVGASAGGSESANRVSPSKTVCAGRIARASPSCPQIARRVTPPASNRAIDPASYQDFLRARAAIRAPTTGSVVLGTRLLEQIVARYPDFAPAWAQLSLTYLFVPYFHPAVFSSAVEQARPIVDEFVPKAEAAAQRALQLDAKSSTAYVTLGAIQQARMQFSAAADFSARALALDGDSPDALDFKGIMLADLGYVKQALSIRQRLLTLEPFVPLFTRITAFVMWMDGQTDEPIAILKRVPEGFGAIRLANVYGAQGRYREAAELLQSRSDTYLPGVADAAVRLLRSAPTIAASPQSLPRLGQYLEFVYLAVGAPSRVLDSHEASLKLNFLEPVTVAPLWASPYHAIRRTQRFKNFVRNAGMVEYWRRNGWPDLCHPTTGDDFVCE